MKNLFEDFPGKEELLDWYGKNGSNIIHEVNNHFHSPYSFSAFHDLNEVFQMAEKENITILGINDFYTTAGYEEFSELCASFRKIPLYNIEFMGLLKSEQEKGIRVNDPNNPGRIYFCGKGLDYPLDKDSPAGRAISSLAVSSLEQTREMLEKTNAYLKTIHPSLELDYHETLSKFTKGMLRERHIAKAVRIKVMELFKEKNEIALILKDIYGGKESSADPENHAALEDEIRSRLLKSGGKGYVKEDEKAFLSLEEIIEIIMDAGGIPTYPVLCDDKDGKFTEFEKDASSLFTELSSRNIYSVELIPGRNSFAMVKEFSRYFHDRKCLVSYGTEHNTPRMIPLKVDTREGYALDEELQMYSFESACVIVANQYLHSRKEQGYIAEDGEPRLEELNEFIELGNAVIEYFLQNRN